MSGNASSFAHVARIIAKGEPPEWLAPQLATFSPAVSAVQITPEVRQRYKKRLRRMQEAVATMIELFPLFDRSDDPRFDHAPMVGDINESLLNLRDWLEQFARSGKGRRPHFGRELCADLIVHYWRKCHGRAEPRSDKAYEACEEYWRACGGEPSSDIQNWRKMVQDASARPEPFLMHSMLVLAVGGTELPRNKRHFYTGTKLRRKMAEF